MTQVEIAKKILEQGNYRGVQYVWLEFESEEQPTCKD